MKKDARLFESTYIFVDDYDGDSWWTYSEFGMRCGDKLRIGSYAIDSLVNTEDWLGYNPIKRFKNHPWMVTWG